MATRPDSMTAEERLRAQVEERLRVALRRAPSARAIPRREASGPAPLAPAQWRLWLLEQLEPGAAYNLPAALRLRGPLQARALEQALVALVRRHEVLRCAFPTVAGQPSLQIQAPPERVLEEVDLTALAPAQREAEVAARAQAAARQAFDLEHGPLLRATLLRLAPDDAALLLAFHHAVSDGWSQEIVWRELSQTYAAAVAGREARLPELPLQYSDYAAWQRARVESGAYAADVAYWREALRDLPALELQSDLARGAQRGARGAHFAFRLPARLQQALVDFSRAAGVTLFTTLAAGSAALLRRSTGQRDFAIGTAVAGRSHAELEGLVGLFVNTLPLRFRPAGEPSFRDMVSHARDVVLAALAHQEVPLEQLVAELLPQRDAARNPFFQVLVTLRTTPTPVLDLPGVTVEPVPLDTCAAKFDWALQFEQRPDGLAGLLEYNTDLFTQAGIERLVGHFETLLTAAVERPATPLSALPLLTAGERRQALAEGAACRRDYQREATLGELFEAQARRTPDAAALVTPAVTLTYDALRRRAGRLAAHLRARGVRRGTRVGLRLERSLDLALAQLAVVELGAAYVPLDGAAPAERLALLARDAGLSLALTRQVWAAPLLGLDLQLVLLDALEWEGGEAPPLETGAGPHDVAYVMYTSGSTGVPKGVAVPQRAVARLVLGTDFCQLGPDDVVAQVSNPAFDAATFEIWGALLNGACLVPLERDEILEPGALARALRESGATAMFLTAALFHQTARVAPAAFATLRTLIVGGDQIDPARAADVLRAGPPGRLVNGYGPTENTTFSIWHLFTLAELEAGSAPIGRPIANSSAHVLDRGLELLPVGVPGELCVGGDGLAHGYVGRPELTAERFVPDPYGAPGARLYRTGDQARRRADGVVEFLGRLDQQVKVRGFRIELGEIEALLARLPGVEQALATAPVGPDGTRRLLAFVTPAGLSEDELRAGLRRSLPGYMLPSTIVALDAFPLTPNGKVDRGALLGLADARDGVVAAHEAPRDALEEALLAIWSDELGRETLGLHDDFFEAGGHSLMATRVIARVRQACGVEVALRLLFDAPTVASFAAQVRAAAGRAAPEPLAQAEPRPAERHEPFPLTDVQQAYWIGRSADFDLGQVGTHLYFEVDCVGLDLAAFESAWRALIARHDMLRAVFTADAEQRVLPAPQPFALEIVELRELDEGAREDALGRLRARLETQVFEPARYPLWELVAARLGADRVRLHFSFDALLADAWSLHVLFADLDALRHGRPLPELQFSFRDYVLAERELRAGARFAQALAYWRARLDSLPDAPALPLRCAPGELRRPTFTRRSATLPAEDWTRLKRRARRAGLTPSATLLQAFSETLAAWSREPRFTLNLTLFNRLPLHAQVERLVGDFTSLNLLEVDAWGGESFEARARLLQRRLWDDLDQRAVSGVQVLRELARRRGTAAVAMPVVFTSTLSLGRDGDAAGAGLQSLGELRAGRTQTPQVWLDHQVGERAGELRFNWDAVEGLFPAGLLDDLFAAYRALLERLAHDDGAWGAARACPLPAWQAAERAAANATDAPLCESTLYELFAARARTQGERPALVSSRRSASYAELAGEARRVSARLRAAGLRPGAHVAVAMDKGWEQIAAVLGVLHAGGVYVPVDPSHPAARLAAIFEQGCVEHTLTQPFLVERVSWPAGVRPLVVEADGDATQAPEEPVRRGPDELAYVIFTSGSTGMPKGVAITHRGAVNTLLDVNARFDVGPDDRVLGLSSLTFDLSVYDVFGTLAAGACLILPEAGEGRDPAAWLTLAERHQATLWNSVPALLQLALETLASRATPARAPLRLALLSGDWIPVRLPQQARASFPGCQVVSLGGATEASIWSIAHEIDDVPPEWTSIPYGRPLANQRFHVLDERLDPRPTWVPGELYIAGVGLALCYWGDQERTQRSFITHPVSGERLYRTGDLGRYLPGGVLEFLGREDAQVKIQGHRIELGEIEAALLCHAGLSAAVACAVGPRESRRLVAYVVPRDAQAPPDEAELRQTLAARLPAYMLPSALVALRALPRSANGKLDRAALPLPGASAAAPAAPAPSGALEARLAELAAAVLGQPELKPESDLLALGATSVDLIRLLNQVERECGVRPELRALYDEPTPAALARAVHARRADSAARPAPVADDEALRDPAEREAFKLTRPGLRRLGADIVRVALPGAQPDELARRRARARRSQRAFATTRPRLAQLGGLLRGLAAVDEQGQPRHLYPSAGGLYAVQTYLHVKPDGLADLAGGAYLFEPDAARLAALAPGALLDARVHEPSVNRPIYERASFSLFLVAQLRVLRRLYGAAAERFAALEAGHVGQVLMEAAPGMGLGLCPIGALDDGALRELLRLEDGHELVYSFVGGALPLEDDLEHETWEL